MPSTKFSVSMITASKLDLRKEIQILDRYTDYYHLDIMDGSYVPNITLSLDYVKSVKEVGTKPADCHLMVNEPLKIIDTLIDNGADFITFHIDTIFKSVFRTFQHVKDRGVKVGIALHPSQSTCDIKEYIHLVDKIIVMTVDPGFGGAKPILEMDKKISKLAKIREERNLDYIIEVDGGCKTDTFERFISAGADMLVLGTGLYNGADLEESFKSIIKEVEEIEERLGK